METEVVQAVRFRTGYVPKVYVINLASAVVRWKRVSASVERAGLVHVRIRAVDARRRVRWISSKVGQRYSVAMRRNLTAGECACIFSHIAALKRFIRDGLPWAIVMEDDAALDHHFRRFVEETLEGYLLKCSVVKIEGIESSPRKGIVLARLKDSSLILPFVPTQGSAAYAVTRRGASRLIERFRTFSDPLDFMLSFYEWLGCTYGEVRPSFVQQENWQDNPQGGQPSTLHADRVNAYSSGPVARNRLQAATDFVIHRLFRRVWRIIVVVGYALRFRTILVSVR